MAKFCVLMSRSWILFIFVPGIVEVAGIVRHIVPAYRSYIHETDLTLSMYRSWILFLFVPGIVEVAGIVRYIVPAYRSYIYQTDLTSTGESLFDEMGSRIVTQTASANIDIDTDHLATTDGSPYYMSQPTEFRSWILFLFVPGIVEVAGIVRHIVPAYRSYIYETDLTSTGESLFDEMGSIIVTQTATANIDIDTDHLATTDGSPYYMSEPTESWILFVFVTGIVEVAGIVRYIVPAYRSYIYQTDVTSTGESLFDEMGSRIVTQTASANIDIDTDHLATTDGSPYYMSEPTEHPLMTDIDFTIQRFYYTPHEITEVEFGTEAANSVYQNPMREFYSVPREITEDEMITETVNSDDLCKQLANLSADVYTQIGIFVFALILLCMTVCSPASIL